MQQANLQAWRWQWRWRHDPHRLQGGCAHLASHLENSWRQTGDDDDEREWGEQRSILQNTWCICQTIGANWARLASERAVKINVCRCKKMQRKRVYHTSGSLNERCGGALAWPRTTCAAARQTMELSTHQETTNTWPKPHVSVGEQRTWSELFGEHFTFQHQSNSVCDVAPLQGDARAGWQPSASGGQPARVEASCDNSTLWFCLSQEQTQKSAETSQSHSSSRATQLI